MAIIEAETTFGRFFIMLILCVIGFLFAPLLLLIGYWRLKRMEPDDPEYKVLKYLLIGGTILTIGGISYLIWVYMPENGEHLDSVKWLPEQASDVCFYRSSFTGECYEYNFPEEKFREMYVKENPQEITKPVKMARYTKMVEGKDPREYFVTVESGLYAEKEFQSRDGMPFYVQIAYDRKTKRVYVYSIRKK